MPLTYGFRSAQPRAAIYTNPFTGAVIATPVLDLSSVLGPAGYADRSVYGNNGVPSGSVAARRGVYEDGLYLPGSAASSVNFGTGASLDIGGDISVMVWEKTPGALGAYSGILAKTDGASGWGLYHIPASGAVQVFFYSGGLLAAGVNDVRNKWAHVGFTVKSNIFRIFADGLQENRGACVMSDAAASNLLLGFTTWPYAGAIELPQLWNGALSPEQVYRNYLAARDVPIYLDDFSSYAVTPVAKAAGSMCGPYRVLTNTLAVLADTAGKNWVVGASAGLYGEGMATWPESASYGMWDIDMRRDIAALDWYYSFFLSAPGYTVGQGYMLVVTAGGAVSLWRDNAGVATALFTTANGVVAEATDYTFRVVRRVGGQFAVYVKGGAYPSFTLLNTPVTDNTYVSGKYHGPLLLLSGANRSRVGTVKLSRVCERPASFPWEFSSGTYAGLISESLPWMRCLTAGVTFIPKDFDWTQREIGVYKGADANVTDLLLVATEIGGATTAAQNGYLLRLSADERVQLCRMDAGVVTVLAQTAAAFVAITTNYYLRVYYNPTTAAFRVEIAGGAYADWTEAIPDTIDKTYTLGNYMCFDLDADDRITAPVKAY